MLDFAKVAAEWLDTEVENVRMVSDGVNKNLSVASPAGGAFVRFSPETLHSRTDLLNEVGLLVECQSQALPCYEAIEIDNALVGGPMLIAGETYSWFATRAVRGNSLTANRKDAHDFGRSLALVHAFDGTLPESSYEEDEMPPDQLSDTYNSTLDAFRGLPLGTNTQGLCHGDSWLGNGIREGTRVVLIDFEFASQGPQVYDIGTFIWSLSPAGSTDAIELFRAFQQGYFTARELEYDIAALRRAVIRKELKNLKFLRRYIFLSDAIVENTLQSNRKLLDFALGDEINRYT